MHEHVVHKVHAQLLQSFLTQVEFSPTPHKAVGLPHPTIIKHIFEYLNRQVMHTDHTLSRHVTPTHSSR